MAGGLASQVLKFLVLVYVARVYGAAEFGSFSFGYSINAFLYVVAQFGLGTFGVREVAQTRCVDRTLIASVTVARLLLAICGTVVTLGVLWLLPQVTRDELYLVAGFGLSNMAAACLTDWIFQGKGELGGWAVLNITWQASGLLLVVLVNRAGAPIWVISFAYAAGCMVAALLGWVWWQRRLKGVAQDSAHTYSVGNVLAAGKHMGAGTMLQTFLVWIDVILVRMLVGQRGAGLYAAGNRIALGLSMLAGFYMQGAFPILARSALEDSQTFRRHFQEAYNHLSAIFVPGAVWGIVYAPETLGFVFKRAEYLAAVPVFQIFQAVLLLVTIASVLYGLGALLAARRDAIYRRGYAITCLLYVVLCPLLTLRWGITGAAVAALLAITVLFIIFEAEVRKLVIPKHAEALLLPLLCGVAAAAIGMFLHLSFIPAVVVLAMAYSVLGVHRFRLLVRAPLGNRS